MNSEELQMLVKQREVMEKEIVELKKSIKEINDTEHYEKGLVDEEGFPRADLDFGKLSDYRLKKKRCSELQNDYADLMKKIEAGLHILHKEYADSGQADKDIEQYEIDQEKKRQNQKKQEELIKQNEEIKRLKEQKEKEAKIQAHIPVPFAIISEVVKDSPAYEDGMKLDDLVCKFGNVIGATFNEVGQLAFVVKNNIERPIPVEVLRRAVSKDDPNIVFYKGDAFTILEFNVTPRPWAGAGVLG